MLEYVETVILALGELVSVPSCSACDQPLPKAAIFCASCAATVVEDSPAALDLAGDFGDLQLFAAARYGGAVATAINRLKHRDRPDLARPLGDLLRRSIRQWPIPHVDLIVPVPLHPARLAERQYNQSALLAGELASELSVSTRFDVLERIVLTASQQGLSARSRQSNVAGAFSVRNELRHERVLLVDDVCTTGATLRACALSLLAGGASMVCALVVAKRELSASA